MQFVTYDQWRLNAYLKMVESGGTIQLPCSNCDNGMVECHCCHSETECEDCDGTGYLNEAATLVSDEEVLKIYHPKPREYFDSVVATFIELAARLNLALIDVIGPFMSYYHKNKYRTVGW